MVGWKFTKFLMSYLKPQVSFSLNFASIFNVMRGNSWFRLLRWISPNLYFDRLLLLKVYKISAKKVQRSYVSWHWRVMQNLKKNWFVVSKMRRSWWILTWALEILKISTFIGSFCAKYITSNLKKYIGVIFHDTEEWCKIWRKTDL